MINNGKCCRHTRSIPGKLEKKKKNQDRCFDQTQIIEEKNSSKSGLYFIDQGAGAQVIGGENVRGARAGHPIRGAKLRDFSTCPAEHFLVFLGRR